MAPVQMRGFTLVELMIILAVGALLMSFALPNFHGLVANHRGAAAINQMLGATKFARSEAILRGGVVTLCPAAANRCLGRHQWHRGAMAFLDRNGNARLDEEDTLLRAFPHLATGERIYWRSFRNRSYLQFHARGYTRWQNGNFLYCPPDDDPIYAHMVIVNAAGRFRKARDLNGDGIVENADGANVECPP